MSQHGFNILNDGDTKNLAIGFMTFIYLMGYNLLFNMPRIALTLWPTIRQFFQQKKKNKKNFNRIDLDNKNEYFTDNEDDEEGDNNDEQENFIKKNKNGQAKLKKGFKKDVIDIN